MSITSTENTTSASTMSVTQDVAPAVLPDDAPPPTSVKRESPFAVVLPPVILGAMILGGWYYLSYGVLDKSRRFLLEPPHRVWSKGFANSEAMKELLSGLWRTGKIAIFGLVIAIIVGVALATLMSQSKLLERAVFPYSVMLQSMPILAIVPLIGFWFGYGKTSRIFIAFFIAVFPIVVNTLFGLLGAEQGMHDMLTLHNAGRFTRLWKVQFPAALPAIFTGLRISAGLSVIGAIVGDFLFGSGEVGIGQMMKRYAARLEGEQLLAAVFMSCAFGVAVFVFFGWMSKRFIGKWSTESRR